MKRLLVILIVAALAVAAFSGCSYFQKTEMNTTSPNVLIHSDGKYTIYLPACDQDGYLCLCAEIIVYFEPEVEGMKGCGFDHDHVFYRERISTQPVK